MRKVNWKKHISVTWRKTPGIVWPGIKALLWVFFCLMTLETADCQLRHKRVTHGLAKLNDLEMQAMVEAKTRIAPRRKCQPAPFAERRPGSNGPWKCQCGKGYSTPHWLSTHVQNSQNLSFQCPAPLCLYLYKSHAGIVSHMVQLRGQGDRGHLEINTGPIVCHRVTESGQVTHGSALQEGVTHGRVEPSVAHMQAIMEAKAKMVARRKGLPAPSATLQPNSLVESDETHSVVQAHPSLRDSRPTMISGISTCQSSAKAGRTVGFNPFCKTGPQADRGRPHRGTKETAVINRLRVTYHSHVFADKSSKICTA